MKSILILLVAVFFIVRPLHAQSTLLPDTDSLKKISEAAKEANRRQMANATIQHFIIKADSNTYGYSIYIDGKLYIQQTTIPAIAGSRGFSSIDKAERTALLAIGKIKQGELPPTLTTEELRQRKIIP